MNSTEYLSRFGREDHSQTIHRTRMERRFLGLTTRRATPNQRKPLLQRLKRWLAQ